MSLGIEAVGPSVPYYLMEPVLKRCTPSQLYRIEDFNPVSIKCKHTKNNQKWLNNFLQKSKN